MARREGRRRRTGGRVEALSIGAAEATRLRSGMRRLGHSTLVVAAALALIAVPALAKAPPQRFFQTKGGGVDCELDDGGGLGVNAYCQTVSPQRSVTLNAAGKVKVCTGNTCIGNAPENVKTLAAGSTVTLGPFHCTVGTATVSCRIKSGTGFSISRAGVKKT